MLRLTQEQLIDLLVPIEETPIEEKVQGAIIAFDVIKRDGTRRAQVHTSGKVYSFTTRRLEALQACYKQSVPIAEISSDKLFAAETSMGDTITEAKAHAIRIYNQ